MEEAVDEAISKSLKEGVLKDLLKKNRAEVRNVVLTEYNEELHLKNVRECGYEEGYDNGYDSGLDQGRRQKEIDLIVKKSPERSVSGTDCRCFRDISRSIEGNLQGSGESSAGV